MGSIHMPTAILAGKLGGSSGNGNAELVVPTFTFDVSNNHGECDMTYAEILAAIEAGKCICAKCDGFSFGAIIYLQLNSVITGAHEIAFSYSDVAEMYPIISPRQAYKAYVYIDANETVTVTIYTESSVIPVIYNVVDNM